MTAGSQPFVCILMGSDSDLPVMQVTTDVLSKFEVPYEVKITSAHRTPDATRTYVKEADRRGCGVFVAGAGLAAHLAGAVAALTVKPVVGVPMDAGPLNGMDALLSTVQMPGGVPVATVAIGKAGAKNAAYLALQILALSNQQLATRLLEERRTNADAIIAKDAALSARRAEE